MLASEIIWHNEESVRFMQSLSRLSEEEWRRQRDLPQGDWSREFQIGKSRMTPGEYFEGMIAHDQHHFQQIRQALDTE